MKVYAASVVIDGSTYSFDKHYDYLIPDELSRSCVVGARVLVPFGRGNIKKQALIMQTGLVETEKSLKSIFSVAEDVPLLTEEMVLMVKWLKENTFCTYFDAIHAILPTGLNLKIKEIFCFNKFADELSDIERSVCEYLKNKNNGASLQKIKTDLELDNCESLLKVLIEKGCIIKIANPIRKVQDATVKMAELVNPDGDVNIKLTARQRDVVNVLLDAGALSVKEIMYFTGVSSVVITNLEKYGVIRLFENEVYRTPDISKTNLSAEKSSILTDKQQTVFGDIGSKMDSDEFSTVLLHGVTGSGKTQVFLKLVEKAVEKGEGVIVMVPEISLTPQMLDLFYKRFGKKVAVFHSALPLGQRLDEWKRVKNGEALIALGTRSAVFAPFSKIGLIVMDEEQEHTYKSEQSPRFHARDVARFRAAYHKCVCILSSATPSIESFSAAKAGKYTLCTLDERYGNAVLPDVIPVDMRSEMISGNCGNISMVLAQEIEKNLQNGEQVILLLNRRGHNTYVSCPSCGYVATCDNCSISMTYHSANNRLMCHYCGHSEPFTTTCKNCGSDHLRYSGAGTQKLEDELALLFPSARVLRLDADTTMMRNAFSHKLTAFANKEYDILIGTQMVAKGLNFPNVTLVGVLGADQSMYSDDFRGFERTFSLLTQVVGRSGRGETPGRAYIQTQNPDSNVIKLAAKQDYVAFYEDEILTRKLMIYPPYCDILSVMFSAVSQKEAMGAAAFFADIVKNKILSEFSDVKLIILKPMPTAVPRVNNKYRFRIIIKCKNGKRFRELINKSVDEFFESKYAKQTSISLDVNPE